MSIYDSPNSLRNLNDEAENLTAELTVVKLNYFEGDNIDILKQCPNLEEIEIYAQSPHYQQRKADFTIDISSVVHLPKLKKFKIIDCPIIDTTPLEQTTQLESIWISDSNIDSIDFVKNYTHLTNIFIYKTNINDIDVLKNMTKLHYLYLTHSKVESIVSLVT